MRERKEEYAKLSLFKLKWPILGSSASSLLQFSSVKKGQKSRLSYGGKLKHEEALGISMQMTLSIPKICPKKISASFICPVASSCVWSVKNFSCS